MQTPSWTKPFGIGAVCGAVALAIFGFSAGGWMTTTKAGNLADTQARSAVIVAMAPVCVQKAASDPDSPMRFDKLRAAKVYERNQMVMDAGWATMPGQDNPDRVLASACMDILSKQL